MYAGAELCPALRTRVVSTRVVSTRVVSTRVVGTRIVSTCVVSTRVLLPVIKVCVPRTTRGIVPSWNVGFAPSSLISVNHYTRGTQEGSRGGSTRGHRRVKLRVEQDRLTL